MKNPDLPYLLSCIHSFWLRSQRCQFVNCEISEMQFLFYFFSPNLSKGTSFYVCNRSCEFVCVLQIIWHLHRHVSSRNGGLMYKDWHGFCMWNLTYAQNPEPRLHTWNLDASKCAYAGIVFIFLPNQREIYCDPPVIQNMPDDQVYFKSDALKARLDTFPEQRPRVAFNY